MGNEVFRYDGKRVLVVGGATGMGAAAATAVSELGAEVVVMDYKPVDGFTSIVVDLRDKDQIDAAIDQCGGTVDALFSCAGVADGTEGIERINFLGHRHMIDRLFEHDRPTLRKGDAPQGLLDHVYFLGRWPRMVQQY